MYLLQDSSTLVHQETCCPTLFVDSIEYFACRREKEIDMLFSYGHRWRHETLLAMLNEFFDVCRETFRSLHIFIYLQAEERRIILVLNETHVPPVNDCCISKILQGHRNLSIINTWKL